MLLVPTSLPRKRKLVSTGKKRKRYPKKPKKDKPEATNQQPPADNIPSDDDEWEDIMEEGDFSANESDIDPEDDADSENEQE